MSVRIPIFPFHDLPLSLHEQAHAHSQCSLYSYTLCTQIYTKCGDDCLACEHARYIVAMQDHTQINLHHFRLLMYSGLAQVRPELLHNNFHYCKNVTTYDVVIWVGVCCQ